MKKRFMILGILLVVSLLGMPLMSCAKGIAITLWAPLNGASFTNSPIVVRGNVSDAKAQLSVNDVAVEVDKKGDFHTTIEASEGSNTIRIVATRGEKTVTHSVTITYSAPLTVEITSPRK